MRILLALLATMSLVVCAFGDSPVAPERYESLAQEVLCPIGSKLLKGYQISAEGMPSVRISTVDSDTSVENFYKYRTDLHYAASNILMVQNVTILAVHRNRLTEDHSLIILNGPPLTRRRNRFVRMSLRVTKLPRTAQVAVMDDPETDQFRLFRSRRTLWVKWAWKRPFSDGIAVRMPGNDFCVDIEVLRNNRPSRWNFFSAQSVLPQVSHLHLRHYSLQGCNLPIQSF